MAVPRRKEARANGATDFVQTCGAGTSFYAKHRRRRLRNVALYTIEKVFLRRQVVACSIRSGYVVDEAGIDRISSTGPEVPANVSRHTRS